MLFTQGEFVMLNNEIIRKVSVSGDYFNPPITSTLKQHKTLVTKCGIINPMILNIDKRTLLIIKGE